MKSLFGYMYFGAFTIFSAPFRWNRKARPHAPMDAATYAAMVAEAERIASPYTRHIAGQRASALEEIGGYFPEVDAMLERAGIVV